MPSLIETIQIGVGEDVTAIDNSGVEIYGGVEAANKAGTAMKEITGEIDFLRNMYRGQEKKGAARGKGKFFDPRQV